MIDFFFVLITIIVFAALFLVSVILYFKWSYTYWARNGLEYVPGTLPFGSMGDTINRKEHTDTKLCNIYNKLRARGLNHGGYYVFSAPFYMPVDPDCVKNVLVTDFPHFYNRNFYYNERDDPVSAHLLNLRGLKWKTLRAKLTPAFSSGHIKINFQTFMECCDQFLNVLNDIYEKGEPVEIKDKTDCFTTDIISTCAFGIECNTLKNPESEFRKFGREIFSASTAKLTKFFICTCFPKLGRMLAVTIVDKGVSQFFTRIVTENIEDRVKDKGYRKDIMQMFLETRLKTNDEDSSLTTNEIIAQCYIFFAAGFETSSNTMSYCLFELATNPDVQETVRKEILAVLKKYDGKLSYYAVMEMSYLNKVLLETLRKHPSVGKLVRRCTKTYKVPNTNVVIKKGIDVVISNLGIHYDPEYYPNPEKFDPQRFTEENIAKRPPCTFLPFGEGPRQCIGLRFALLEVKVGVISFVRNYKFSLNSKTTVPLKRDLKALLYSCEGGIWLDLEKI